MTPAMYIFLNKGLGMSTGKAAAQAGHAAVEAYRVSMDLAPNNVEWFAHFDTQPTNVLRHWHKGGHYAKYVMEAASNEQLRTIERYINDRGFRTALIVDEGHTEDTYFVPTALGVEVVDKDNPHVAATFGEFKSYKDPQPDALSGWRGRFVRWVSE